MKSLTDTFKLYNGVEIPCVGLGTWQTADEVTKNAVLTALAFGCRHIDTAAAYGSESGIGDALADSGIDRKEVFITSKLRNACHGYKSTMDEFEKTLSNLKTDYLDLYLIHWPNPVQYRTTWKWALTETWRAFEDLYKDGRIRAIGVSNFMPHHIEALMEKSDVLPMVNQLKLCPGITQPETVSYCRKNKILAEAYSPFGTGSVFKNAQIAEIAEKYNKSVGQTVLRWCLQNGFLPLPKSANPMRIKQNSEIFDFELSDSDVDIISNLEGCCGEVPNPDNILF